MFQNFMILGSQNTYKIFEDPRKVVTITYSG